MSTFDAKVIEARITAGINAMQEQDPSTAGQIDSAEWGLQEWDRELNHAYEALLEKLPATATTKLKLTQRRWIDFRDGEFTVISEIYGMMQGSMYHPMSVFAQMEAIKERTLRLLAYLDLLQEI